MKLGDIRLVELIIKDEENNTIYEGLSDNMPDNLKTTNWNKTDNINGNMIFYI